MSALTASDIVATIANRMASLREGGCSMVGREFAEAQFKRSRNDV